MNKSISSDHQETNIPCQRSQPWGMPGETHTLTVPDDCTETIALFTVFGSLMHVDPEGNATGYDDVFTRIERYRDHFEAVGLGADFVKTFMR